MDYTQIDTPALIIDKDKVAYNIQQAIAYAGGLTRLRPHVKTHKTLEVAKMQCDAGITKFKCATIPEAEMLGMAGAKDVLIAYQPQGPKVNRVLKLVKKFPDTTYSVLIDNKKTASEINDLCQVQGIKLKIYIDVNDGHNRTGIQPEDVVALVDACLSLEQLDLVGLHCYDGHIRMSSLEDRTNACKADFEKVLLLKSTLEEKLNRTLNMVAGGSPSFSVHAEHHEVECSPGTWIYWDERYESDYPELPFVKSGKLLTRVISKIDAHTYCLDLGHKSVASEMQYPRVVFQTELEIEQTGHSEEHMIVKCEVADALEVGEILTAYPYHICPTVALYDRVQVVEDDEFVGTWKVIARDRKITV